MENQMAKSIGSGKLISHQLDQKETKKKSITSKMLGWAGVGLCGLCCALPIIGGIAGIAFLTAIAVYLEMIGILALGLAGIFFWKAYYDKRKAANSCDTSCDMDCGCSTEANGRSKNSINKSTGIACDLTALTSNEKDNLIKNSNEIFGKVKEVRELPDGYTLSINDDSATMLSKLANFMAYDRLCCPFIRHGIVVEPQDGGTWLQMTGGTGVKAYISAELDNLLPDEVAFGANRKIS